jgi:predicted negative regulator of RcsB-dependent stress response
MVVPEAFLSVDKIHRRELKHDAFVDQVGHSVEYAADHKGQIVKWAGVAVALFLLVLGYIFYSRYQHEQRQEALRAAMRVQEAQIGANTSEFVQTFATQAEKDQATQKAWTEVAGKYGSKPEALIAKYYMGINAADKGNLADAEKHLKEVADSSNDVYSSQAKLSLAQIYEANGRIDEAEKTLRSLISSPTILVSKEQATIALAKILSRKNPAEARKLLEPLRTERSAVSRAAISALGDIR